ncbi:UDP-N-acetylglucosamine--N-acetylmuramyl-(pentapeptide) pyrophosphoryl-undecaprenol N-acetylglucosamine transferase [Paractinoplanes toevensis]|uniref:UDP-N-acetylglucosamine--N-acetylmuramyl-(pentapeptide) pyrophosphoryl-undecaprenol N-acetylglucosamine transferase n=2 Tax=Paractinoplanes toevensis TaxID=571911 RepID=A0A919TF61_9ACTN|nr:UDP-N-acetylglucosamine--N-acetylmuramyl-(pentapeptide) pyrophosphoryl-undecaprenol N-acetylglucosamine transferase [Actinoplanes toevensis]
MLRLLVTGGGTGGHTYPALTTIRAVQARAASGRHVQVLWVGVGDGLEARVAAAEQIPFAQVSTGRFRRSPNRRERWANLTDLPRVPVGIGQATRIVAGFRPDVVFATGGYVALPVGVAAWLLRRRLVVHEQTLAVGAANRVLARLADRVLLSHRSSMRHLPVRAQRRAVVTGNPIRPQLLSGNPERARMTLNLDGGVPVVLVSGGAQGAQQINQLVAEVLPQLLPVCQLVHQTGPANIEQARQVAAGLPASLAARYRPVAYLHDELPDLLAAADLVVARAGAGTVAELTALGKPMVLIPLVPTGGDEQRRTARHLAEHNAAVMLDSPNPHRLCEVVLDLLADTGRRAAMAVNARLLGHPDAADRVADHLLDPPAGTRPGDGERAGRR